MASLISVSSSSANVRLNTTAVVPGYFSVLNSASMIKAFVLPPPAAPPYRTSFAHVAWKAACLGVGL